MTHSAYAVLFQIKVAHAPRNNNSLTDSRLATSELLTVLGLLPIVAIVVHESCQKAYACCNTAVSLHIFIAIHWSGIHAAVFAVIVVEPCECGALLKTQRKNLYISGDKNV